MPKQSTKQCPDCGNTHLILVSTQNLKLCSDCGSSMTWYLEEGQKSPLTGMTGCVSLQSEQ